MRKAPLPPIQVHEYTDIGRRRHENQDSMGYLRLEQIPYQEAHLCIVADGMGGASGGQVASSIAVEKILEYFKDDPNMEPDVALRESIEQAAAAILARARKEPSLTGMGTTCVCTLALNGYLFAAHVGDSRIYLQRDGVLHRITRDHSAVQRLVEAGILTEEEAKNHPRQNVLSRVLGSEHPLYVELLGPPWKLQEGDRVLLCSDGLHGEISDEEIKETLQTLPASETAETLVRMANEAGGNDNITVQVFAYGPIPAKEEPENWQQFNNEFNGYAFNAMMLVFLFFLGYLTGFYTQNPQDNQAAYRPKVAVAQKTLHKPAPPRRLVVAPPPAVGRIAPHPQKQGQPVVVPPRTTTAQPPIAARRSVVARRSLPPQRSVEPQRSKAPQERCQPNHKTGDSGKCVAPPKTRATAPPERRLPSPKVAVKPIAPKPATPPVVRVAPTSQPTPARRPTPSTQPATSQPNTPSK